MTKQEAKDISIEVWQYLADHPEKCLKRELPQKIYDRIKRLKAKCPLCDLFNHCIDCPLDDSGNKCCKPNSWYKQWHYAQRDDWLTRKEAAENILSVIHEWEINND